MRIRNNDLNRSNAARYAVGGSVGAPYLCSYAVGKAECVVTGF